LVPNCDMGENVREREEAAVGVTPAIKKPLG
jgi:hypothetical protein